MVDSRFPNWLIDIEKGTIYSLKHKKYIGAIGKKGYLQVYPPKGYKHIKLHQYIWMCANKADIPKGYDVHHIDHNKQNNSIYNLELVEQHKHRSEHNKGKIVSEETKCKISLSLQKQVAQYTLDGELNKVWNSAMEAERNGYHQGHISECCQGKRKTHKGFIWKYV